MKGNILRVVGIFTSALFFSSFSAVRADAESQEPINLKTLIEHVFVGGGDYGQSFSLSPAKDAVAFATLRWRVDKNDHELRWYAQNLLEESEPVFIGEGGELILNLRQRQMESGAIYGHLPRWSPDGEWIAYVKKNGGEIQIWVSKKDGSVQKQVTRNAADVMGSFGYRALFQWSDDGNRLLFEVGRSRTVMSNTMESEGRRGFHYDERFIPSYSNRPLWMRCGDSRREQRPVASQSCSPTIWTHDLRTSEERVATEDETIQYIRKREREEGVSRIDGELLRGRFFGGDGSTIEFKNVDDAEYPGPRPPRFIKLTKPNGVSHSCKNETCVSPFLVEAWKTGEDVIFLRQQGQHGFDRLGTNGFYAWTPETNKLRQILITLDEYSECQLRLRELICFHEASTSPRRLVALNIDDGSMRVIFDPNPSISSSNFTKVEHIELVNDEGLPTFAKLVYPRGYQHGRRYPLIVAQGDDEGFLQGAGGKDYPVPILANAGFFIVLVSEYMDYISQARFIGQERYKAEFKTHQRRRYALEAFEDIISKLAGRGLVDPNRVGVTGLSSASSNARFALVNSDLFSAASLSTGYSGPQQYYFATASPKMRAQVRDLLDGAYPFERAAMEYAAFEELGWHTRSMIFPPVLWQVADRELSSALFDYTMLEDEDHPVEMHVFPNERHIRWQPIHRYYTNKRNVQWFQYWLKGQKVNDPVDPDQYERWSVLCNNYIAKLKKSDDRHKRDIAKEHLCANVVLR